MCRSGKSEDESNWVVYLGKRDVWWKNEHYEWYYRVGYEGFEQLVILGAVPLALLIYFNIMIYKGIGLPPNLEIQGAEEINRLSRERKLADVIIVIVCIFIVSHSTRISWYIYYTVIHDDIINCPKHHPTLSGVSPWTYAFALVYDLLLVINASVNTIVYCSVNARFRFHVIRLLKLPFKKLYDYFTSNEAASLDTTQNFA